MRYKKWLITVLSLVVVFFFVAQGVRFYLQSYVFDAERSIWAAKAKIIQQIDPSYKGSVILGASRTLALNPQYLNEKYGFKSINLSVGGGNPPTTYFLLKRLLDRGIKPQAVYLEVNPENLSRATVGMSGILGERFVRFAITPAELLALSEYYPDAPRKYSRIHEFPYREYFYKDWSTMAAAVYRRATRGVSDAKMEREMLNNGGFYLFGGVTDKFETITKKTGVQQVLNYEDTLDLVNISYQSEIYLEKTIQLLEDNNIKYKFFFSPIPKARQGHDLFGNGKQLFQKIKRENIDWQIMYLGEECFSDPSHLNYPGSVIFNDYFYQKIVLEN